MWHTESEYNILQDGWYTLFTEPSERTNPCELYYGNLGSINSVTR
jgi:hypothetical protein